MLGNQKAVRTDKSPNAAIRDYRSASKPRMHGFDALWWISCSSFKHCEIPPNSSCRHLADFDDDTSAKTWLHDVNTTPMKFSERTLNHLSGMPVLARHAEKRLSLGSLFELDVLKK